MRLILITCAVLALAACQKPEHQAANEAAPAADVGPHKGVDRSHKGQAFPDVKFLDEEDKPMSYQPLRGVPTLVNLWATWCAPCVKELPTLDALAKSGNVQVLAVSQDSGPHASVAAFLQGHQIVALKAYQDPKMALSGSLGPDTVLPTSILFDANGKEVWRYVGDLDWTSPEAAKLLSEAAASPTPG